MFRINLNKRIGPIFVMLIAVGLINISLRFIKK